MTSTLTKPSKAKRVPEFTYYQSSDGCDDQWVIHNPALDKEVATIVYWNDDDAWASRARSDARLLAASPQLFNAAVRMLACLDELPASTRSRRATNAAKAGRAAIHAALHKPPQ